MLRSPASVRLVLSAAALLAGSALPSAAHAQCWLQPDGTYWCDDGSGPGDGGSGSTDGPPSIGFQPREAAVPQPTIAVTIQMADDNDLVDATFRVYRGSEDVTSQFSFTKTYVAYPAPYTPRVYATATGFTRLSEAGPVQLRAEICDNAPQPFCRSDTGTFTMAVPGVEVTPDGTEFSVVGGTTRTASFTVINRGTVAATFALAASCRDGMGGGAVSGCSPSQPSVTLGPGASQAVAVSFPAMPVGRIVQVQLEASQQGQPGVRDAGWQTATVHGNPNMVVTPTYQIVDLNSTGLIDRSQCVTVAVGPGAAYECGDLRLAHALPAHRTRGRTWAPVLLHASNQVNPRATVYLDVGLHEQGIVPTTVDVVVRLASGATHKRTFVGSDWLPGTTRRVGVQWDAGSMPTGLYAYTAEVTFHYPNYGYVRTGAPVPGELAVVNRSGHTTFGQGWWMAGLEQLVRVGWDSGAYRLLRVGGDGSTRVYEPAFSGAPGHGSRWTAVQPGAPADTLVGDVQASGAYRYTRRLRGGGRIEYDGMGRQVLTVNRLGQATTFAYRTEGMDRIHPPGGGPGGAGWVFNYNAQGGLASVDAGSGRTTTFEYALGGYRWTAVHDPGLKPVRFAYADASAPLRITSRTGRDGTQVHFTHGPAGKLHEVRTDMAGTAADIRNAFRAAEEKGVAWSDAQTFRSAGMAAVYTLLDGARTDVQDHTWLWVGRWGAPERIRDALGAETVIKRGDARFPALATEVASHTGVVSTAVYDDRGRVTSSTVTGAYGGSETSTSTQEWDPVCERPTMIKSPGVDAVWAGYDPVTCNVLWQRQGADTARTVNFHYYPAGHAHAGQVDSVQGPRDAQGRRAVERVRYDARGNLERTISPLGFLTLYQNDELGRVRDVYTPVTASTANDETALLLNGVRQSYTYDLADRVRQAVTYGPAIDHGHVDLGTTQAEWLRVETEYDDGGRPLKVTRTVSPNPAGLQPQVTEYQYDKAGRKTHEWPTPLIQHYYEYDPAGNVVREITPRLATIINRYDAANRLVRREVQGAFWPQTAGSCPPYQWPTCDQMKFPFYPNYGTGYTVPEEWTYFGYDAAGNLRWAENADAVVRRSYFPNGQLRGDTLSIRGGGSYGLRFDYHTATGQLRLLHHPENLAGAGKFDEYLYNPLTGLLSGVLDRNGNAFSFHHDNTGRLTSTVSVGVTESRVYDVEGRLSTRTTAAPGNVPLISETYTHDARDKVVQVATQPTLNRNTPSTFRQFYSGLGNLVMTDWANVNDPQWQRERFTTDALGNMVHKRTVLPGTENQYSDHPDYAYTLDPWKGHVTQVRLVDVSTHPPGSAGEPQDQTRFGYDEAGNQETSWQRVDGPSPSTGGYQLLRVVDGRSYYGHDGKLRAFQQYEDHFSPSKSSGIWEEYRYDPLGRRVMVITKRPPELCNGDAATCISATTQFVWSGDQLLWEIKSAEGLYSQQAGGVVSYTHGGGIDRPLAIWKSGVGSIIPHENWRGQMARGTYGAGTRAGQSSDCTQYPPQNCEPIPWPGWNTSAWHEEATKPELTGVQHYWYGSLAVGMRDASGQMYMRNRYYNPQSGQFTQPDPIGLAGGMNVYGFAAGDPVTYSDPYGLAPEECPPCQTMPLPLPAPPFLPVTGTDADRSSASIAGAISSAVASAAAEAHEDVAIKFVTYTRTHPSTGQVYSGRAKGWGSPQAIVRRRATTHPPRLNGFGPPIVDAWANGARGYAAIRGREQQLIDYHGGAQSEGGTSANVIRAVSPRNPLRNVYENAANAYPFWPIGKPKT